jgi:DNA-binding NarL/FixJ family response regulator
VPIALTLIHLYDDFPATALQQWLVALQVTNVRADTERRVRPWGDGVRERLTPFERHLLELIASGLKRKEIARAVNKSPQTVSNSMTVAKDKLGARSLAEAAVWLARRDATSSGRASRKGQSNDSDD